MAVTHSEIVSQMRAALALSEPDLDTSIGTTVRKIIDAVAEVTAEGYTDRTLIEYQYDIEAKRGADLDDFVSLVGGLQRYSAKRATGTVVFERSTAALHNIFIPIGTQLATGDPVPTVVATIVPAVLPAGGLSIEVPVQAIVGGTQGNVAAHALVRRITPLEGITGFTNPASLTGGADPEDDEQLRLRWRRTAFRNLAGTEQMFLAVALDNEAVTQANVIGATSRFREQIDLQSGIGTSTIQDVKHVYVDSVVLGPNIDAGQILTPGVHYNFSASTPPVVTVLDAAAVPNGVYDLEFEYVSTASRNDPVVGITNRVDIYVNGDSPTEAVETAVFRLGQKFVFGDGSALDNTHFERLDETPPVVGNYFIPLAFGPVTDPALSNSIVIGGVTYVEGTDFFLVNDITASGGTPTSLSGIELRAAENGGTKPIPADGTIFTAEYVFNAVPRDIQSALRAWRLVTTDAHVHQAKKLRLNFYFAVILRPGYSLASVEDEAAAALSAYLNRVGFNGAVQESDLIEVIHRIGGVDAVRFTTSADNTVNFAIQRVTAGGTVLHTYANPGPATQRVTDVLVGDDELPVFNSVTLILKAQNSFASAP